MLNKKQHDGLMAVLLKINATGANWEQHLRYEIGDTDADIVINFIKSLQQSYETEEKPDYKKYKMQEFSCKQSKTALGLTYKFSGPGTSQYGSEIHLPVPYDAETVLRMLNDAFEKGQENRSYEIAKLLGAKHKDDRF